MTDPSPTVTTFHGDPIPARATAIYKAQIVDQAGVGIPAGNFTSLTVSLYDTASGQIVNSVETVDILNTGRGTIDSSGNLTITFLPDDMAPVGLVQPGFLQYRQILIEWAYNSGDSIGRHEVDFSIRILPDVESGLGRLPQWSYSGDPATSEKDAIRFLIGDTDECDPLLNDGELVWTYGQVDDLYGAAAICCLAIAARLSRQADQISGQSGIKLSQRARAFRQRAVELDTDMLARGGALPYAGGIEIADVLNNRQDTSLVQPVFQIGMDDSFIPVGPTGNEPQDFVSR